MNGRRKALIDDRPARIRQDTAATGAPNTPPGSSADDAAPAQRRDVPGRYSRNRRGSRRCAGRRGATDAAAAPACRRWRACCATRSSPPSAGSCRARSLACKRTSRPAFAALSIADPRKMRPTGAAGSTPSPMAALLSDGGRRPKPSGSPVAKHSAFGTSATASGPGRACGRLRWPYSSRRYLRAPQWRRSSCRSAYGKRRSRASNSVKLSLPSQ